MVKAKSSWIGEYPRGWRELRADFLTTSVKLAISDKALSEKLVFHYSIPNVQEIGDGKEESGNDVESSKNLITTKQLLVSKLNPRKRTVCISQPKGETITVCSGEFVPIIPDGDLDIKYCYYVWLSDKVTKLLSSKVQSVTKSHQRVDPDAIRKIEWAWPPYDTQQKIADFLDRKTAQIDALIEKKRTLIAKLKEKRLAVITEAVTRGLDPDAPLKDSGIEWLGQVPAHWEAIPLGFLVEIKGGMTPNTGTESYWDGDIPWVTPKDMKIDEISDSIDHVTEEAIKETGLSLIDPNAILIVVRGMILAHSFPTAINRAKVTINQDMKALRCEDRLNPEYLRYTLAGYEKTLSKMATESAHGTRKMETGTLKKFSIPLPPRTEQIDIIDALKNELSRLDKLSSKSESTITRLTEYRTALITAAVTGQL
jgi:type I restriction enzyme S subunit